MKAIAALAVSLAFFSVSPASCETVDLSTIKCKEFLDSGKDNISYIAMWLHGYYAGKADAAAVIDFDKFTKTAGELGKYCAENPTLGLITAADKTFSNEKE